VELTIERAGRSATTRVMVADLGPGRR
jgi:hypothetical protein